MGEYNETVDGIHYTLEIEPEDIPVRGNAIATDDDALDREYEDAIIARLDSGDLWAWCTVKVTAQFEGFEGVAYLGGCCYDGVKDFVGDGASDYYADLKDQAKGELIEKLGKARSALQRLETGTF